MVYASDQSTEVPSHVCLGSVETEGWGEAGVFGARGSKKGVARAERGAPGWSDSSDATLETASKLTDYDERTCGCGARKMELAIVDSNLALHVACHKR